VLKTIDRVFVGLNFQGEQTLDRQFNIEIVLLLIIREIS